MTNLEFLASGNDKKAETPRKNVDSGKKIVGEE
jgi:hypothetical protein